MVIPVYPSFREMSNSMVNSPPSGTRLMVRSKKLIRAWPTSKVNFEVDTEIRRRIREKAEVIVEETKLGHNESETPAPIHLSRGNFGLRKVIKLTLCV